MRYERKARNAQEGSICMYGQTVNENACAQSQARSSPLSQWALYEFEDEHHDFESSILTIKKAAA